MLTNVPEDWTIVVVILNVLTLMGVFYADVTTVLPEMAYIAMVSILYRRSLYLAL